MSDPADDSPLADPGGEADPSDGDGMQRGYARLEARNAEVRATLEPLAPGERPWPLLASIGVMALLAVGNAVGYALEPDRVPAAGVALFCAVMGLAVYGLWQRTAWAVLGALTLFGMISAFGMISLLVASGAPGAILSLATVSVSGTLFWKLIRVLGRIQAPKTG